MREGAEHIHSFPIVSQCQRFITIFITGASKKTTLENFIGRNNNKDGYMEG